jgi:fructose-1,6-bisphosphatase/inositol monophosphatase family enzyme
LADKNLPLRIIAEEHGIVDLNENLEYLMVLDGVDGSSALVKNPYSKCGTMMSIADNLSPNYDNFVFAGITEYATNKIVYGIKNEGVHAIENPGENKLEIIMDFPKFKSKEFSKDTLVLVNCYNSEYAEGVTKGMIKFEKFMEDNFVKYLKGKVALFGGVSSAAMCIDLIYGNVDAVAQMVAKEVFEPPAMYLLAKELGGHGVDFKGNDIGNRKWERVDMNLEGMLFSSSKSISESLIRMLK